MTPKPKQLRIKIEKALNPWGAHLVANTKNMLAKEKVIKDILQLFREFSEEIIKELEKNRNIRLRRVTDDGRYSIPDSQIPYVTALSEAITEQRAKRDALLKI